MIFKLPIAQIGKGYLQFRLTSFLIAKKRYTEIEITTKSNQYGTGITVSERPMIFKKTLSILLYEE